MEPRFGHDFGQVRVHADATAAASARAVDAFAYTVGRDIVFGAGRYAPRTDEGQRLLAHELTHVVQQRHGAAAPDSAGLAVGPRDTVFEHEADAMGARVLDGPPAATRLAEGGPAVLRRQFEGGGGRFGGGGAGGSWEAPPAGGQTPGETMVAPAAEVEEVEVIRLSCESNTIDFHRPSGAVRYRLDLCDLTDGEYMATVEIRDNDIDFLLGEDVPEGIRFRFRYRIEPGQPNPTTFFRRQRRVRIIVGPAPVPAPGPTSGSRTPLVCSRPLNFPAWTGLRRYRHAFINDPPFNYAIREPLVWGNGVTTSCSPSTDASGPPDDPATSICKECVPPPGQTIADVSRCLRATHTGYPNPNLYRNLPDRSAGWRWGPNSNSYAAWMARCCHRFSPAGLGRLPGWNHGPAGPCPPRPTTAGPAPSGGVPDAGERLPGGVPEQPGAAAAAGGDGAAPVDLHAFGNRTKPRDPRLGTDISPNPDGTTVGPEPKDPPWPDGASTFADPAKAPLTGHYHRIGAGTPMSEGLRVIADGSDAGGPAPETHHTIFPIRVMPFTEFVDKFQGLGWTYAGKR